MPIAGTYVWQPDSPARARPRPTTHRLIVFMSTPTSPDWTACRRDGTPAREARRTAVAVTNGSPPSHRRAGGRNLLDLRPGSGRIGPRAGVRLKEGRPGRGRGRPEGANAALPAEEVSRVRSPAP